MIEILSAPRSANDLGKFRQIYLDSFPPEERREWEQIVAFAEDKEHPLTFFSIYDEGMPVGFLTAWRFDNFSYIEHFAFDAAVRGRGLGSQVLDMLKDELADDGSLVLEVEPESQSEEARRRIGFYQRRGLRIVDKEYIQPPYRPGLPSVPLWIMAYGDTPVDTEEVTRVLHREIYGA